MRPNSWEILAYNLITSNVTILVSSTIYREHLIKTIKLSTAWKMSKYGAFSGPYFSAFGQNPVYRPEKLRIWTLSTQWSRIKLSMRFKGGLNSISIDWLNFIVRQLGPPTWIYLHLIAVLPRAEKRTLLEQKYPRPLTEE